MSREIVRALNERAGCRLELRGLIEQGQSGAAYVRWPDGRDSVVTTAFASIGEMRRTAEVLEQVKTLGIPVPRHEFLFDLGGTVAVVQERLPGSTVHRPDRNTVAAVIAMNERFAGLLADRLDVPMPVLSLGRADDPTPVDSIKEHGPRARRLLDAIRSTAGGPDIVGEDLVHTDLTVANMLFGRNGEITGVIDWNYGVARGDRYFGVSKLLHNLRAAAAGPADRIRPTPDAIEYVEQYLVSHLDAAVRRRYWAHQTLNMLYSSRRWGTPESFDIYLELGEAGLK